MQRTFAALQVRLQHLAETPHVRILSMPESLPVLTPTWKTALDAEWKRRKAKVPQYPHRENFGIMGLPGAPGPCGPDGVVPAGATPVRVSADQEKQLLETLTTETALRTKTETLRQQLTELAKRIYLAEGERGGNAGRTGEH